jgi:hypothetical protein
VAIESVIGHLKAEHRMGRNHPAHASCDAVDHNFSLLLDPT